jgi:hypothetical protein
MCCSGGLRPRATSSPRLEANRDPGFCRETGGSSEPPVRFLLFYRGPKRRKNAIHGRKRWKATSAAEAAKLPKERSQFRALILVNPNYFGNIKVSPFPPVVKKAGDTSFEQIGVGGFQPQFNRLDAVVYIKRPSGYGDGLCTDGTPEFVRFYISFDNGAAAVTRTSWRRGSDQPAPARSCA